MSRKNADNIDLNVYKPLEKYLAKYEIEFDGLLFCQNTKYDGKTTTFAITVGFFLIAIEGKIQARPWDELESVSKTQKTIIYKFHYEDQIEEFSLHFKKAAITDKVYQITKNVSRSITTQIPRFEYEGNSDKIIPYSSRPDVYIKIYMSAKKRVSDSLAKYFCSRPKRFALSQFLQYSDYIPIILSAIDITNSIETFCIDCDINPIQTYVLYFLKETKTIKTVEFNFSVTGVTPQINIPSIFQAIIDNPNTKTSLTDIKLETFLLNNILIHSLFNLLEHKPIRSLEINRSLCTYLYDDFLNGIQSKRYFKSLKKFVLSGIIYEGPQFIDPLLFFHVSQSIPKLGLCDSLFTLPILQQTLQMCEQNVPGRSVNLDLTSVSGDCDIPPNVPFFFNANISKLSFANSLMTPNNIFHLLNALFVYNSNDITIDLSGLRPVNNDWDSIWSMFSIFKGRPSNYIVGFIWNRNPINSALLDILTNCPRLKNLQFNDPYAVSPAIINQLKVIVSNAKALETLKISNWHIPSEDMNELLSYLKHKKQLAKLDLTNNGFDQKNLTLLSAAILPHETFRKLRLSSEQLNIELYTAFIGAISSHKTQIVVSYPQFDDAEYSKQDQLYAQIVELQMRPNYENMHSEKNLPQYFNVVPLGGMPKGLLPHPSMVDINAPPAGIAPPSAPVPSPPSFPFPPVAAPAPFAVPQPANLNPFSPPPAPVESNDATSTRMGPSIYGVAPANNAYISQEPAVLPPSDDDNPYEGLISLVTNQKVDILSYGKQPIDLAQVLQSSLPRAEKKQIAYDMNMDLRTGRSNQFVTRRIAGVKAKDLFNGRNFDTSISDTSGFKNTDKEPEVAAPKLDIITQSYTDYVEDHFALPDLIARFKQKIDISGV